jgi:Na+-driven multidrug efflux pump
VRVGMQMGERNPAGARRTVRISLCLAAAYGLVTATFVLSVRHFWGRIFTADPDVLALVSRWITLLVAYSAFDALQVRRDGEGGEGRRQGSAIALSRDRTGSLWCILKS